MFESFGNKETPLFLPRTAVAPTARACQWSLFALFEERHSMRNLGMPTNRDLLL